jgi:hypothetical protein
MEAVFASLPPALQARLLDSNFKLGPGWAFPKETHKLVFGVEDAREVTKVITKFGMHQQWYTDDEGRRVVAVDGLCPGTVKHPQRAATCLTDHIDVDSAVEWYRRMNFYGLGWVWPWLLIRAITYVGAWWVNYLGAWHAKPESLKPPLSLRLRLFGLIR